MVNQRSVDITSWNIWIDSMRYIDCGRQIYSKEYIWQAVLIQWLIGWRWARKRGRMRSKLEEAVFERVRWSRWRRRMGWGWSAGGEEEKGRDQEFLSKLITWPEERKIITRPIWKLHLSFCYLSNFFSSPPVEVKYTGRALQTDSTILPNVVPSNY